MSEARPRVRGRPNVVIIYADQQRHDTIGALGGGSTRTPNLDRLVREGASFTQATTPCPVSMPARWSLHTGQYTSTHRCYSNHHPGPRPAASMPAVLRDAGYLTGLVGKNHSFLTPADLDHLSERPPPADRAAARARAEWLRTRGRPLFPRLSDEPVPGGVAGDPDHARTDEAMRFVDAAGSAPFFLWLSYHHPHTPYHVPEPFFSMYGDPPMADPVAEDDLAAARKPFRQQFHRMNNDAVLPFDSATVTRMRAVYCGMVSLLDAEAGRFLEFLASRGLERETLVVFMSDHGDYMGDHGLVTKSPSLYDCLVRTPLIVRWPGQVPAGARNAELASHVDVMPTVLAAAGCEVPSSVQGLDLGPFMRGEAEGLRETALSEYGVPGRPYSPERLAAEGLAPGSFRNPGRPDLPWEGNPVSLAGRIRMARTCDWKLVQEEGGQSELYDLGADPGELRNLHGLAGPAATQRWLEMRLDDWKRRIAAAGPDDATGA